MSSVIETAKAATMAYNEKNWDREIPACQVVTVEGGRVKHYAHYFDMLTLLTQIGATLR
jgi:hypothetical protein